jgi:hypothetical protein
MVSGNNNKIELFGDIHDPIILRQGIVQVCNDETSHFTIPWFANSKTISDGRFVKI